MLKWFKAWCVGYIVPQPSASSRRRIISSRLTWEAWQVSVRGGRREERLLWCWLWHPMVEEGIMIKESERSHAVNGS